MNDLVNLIVSNGMSVVIIAYMLFKDFKFNETITTVLEQINITLAKLETHHMREDE